MTLPQTELIEEYASMFFTIKEIALLINCSEIELRNQISNVNHDFHQAYNRGKMKTTLMVRKQEIELARLGSPVAIELMQKYMSSQIIDENE